MIDAGDRWTTEMGYEVPGVVLDGGTGALTGLDITASESAVYGLQIIRFSRHGVYVRSGGQNNTIGGAGTKRNVISRNGWNGVQIHGSTTTSNTVTGNYVGTNPAGVAGLSWDGVADWGNAQHGVSIWYGDHNRISENLVADNGWSGVAIDAIDYGVVIYNTIGTDVDGEPLGNGYYGVHVANDALIAVSLNTIAFNRRGVHVGGSSRPTLYANTVYSNTASTLVPPTGGGIFVSDPGSAALIVANEVFSNTARYGGGIGVQDDASGYIYNNTIRANRAYTTGNVSVEGGGIHVEGADANIRGNLILSNTASGDPAGTPFPNGGGIYLGPAAAAYVGDNEIRGNRVDGNAGGGGGLATVLSGEVTIRDNVLEDNRALTWSYGGSAIEINNHSSAPAMVIAQNRIVGNDTRFGGAVNIEFSSLVNVENNLIVDNRDDGLYILDSTTGITSTHNTIARNTQSGILLDDSYLRLYNTLLISNYRYGVETRDTYAVFHSRNDVWGNGSGSTNAAIPFYMNEDPLFFDAAANLYALRVGSPCIDAGNASLSSPTSYNGLSRPQGTGPDIGAYEMPSPLFLPLALRGS